MAVGRRRTIHKNLPPRLHLKRGRYYYGRNQTFLADNLADALTLWAQREAAVVGARMQTFADLAGQYAAKVIPTKALRTQRDNHHELANLLKVFGRAAISSVRLEHVRGYLDNRGAPVRANREIALLSHVWNWGRDRGMIQHPNPCLGVKRHKETGRDRYVTDDELWKLWDASSWPLRDALDLHYLTGQRPGDVLRMRLTDLRDGCLWVRQGKTKAPLRLRIEGDLAAVIERIQSRSYAITSLALVRDENGQPMTYSALAQRFRRARTVAGVTFQLRDLRGKAGTDLEDLALAQKLLGHRSRSMTERYIKPRAGDQVSPVVRKLRTNTGTADS
jgi:integrase